MQAASSLSSLDYLLIKRTAARWNQAVARQDLQEFVRCFTSDATMKVSDAWQDRLSGTFRGHAELSRYLVMLSGAFAEGRPRFWHNLPVIESDGRSTTFQAYFIAFVPLSKEVAWIGSGIHRDHLRKEGGDWRFTHRHLEIEHCDQGEWPELAMSSLQGIGAAITPVPNFCDGPANHIEPGQCLDYELILQTMARYIFYWDRSRATDWIGLFTEDARFQVFGVDELYKSSSWHSREMPTVYVGHDELRTFIEAAAVGKSEDRERHWNSQPLIRIEGDTATAYVPCMTRTAGHGRACTTIVTNLYRDRFRRRDGQWFFQERIAMPEAVSDRARLAGESLGGLYVDLPEERIPAHELAPHSV